MRDKPEGDAARPDLRFERRASITAGAVLAVALVVSVVGSIVTYTNVRTAFSQHTGLEHARGQLSALERLELEQDTGLRGFLSTGESVFLEPYRTAKPQFTPLFK